MDHSVKERCLAAFENGYHELAVQLLPLVTEPKRLRASLRANLVIKGWHFHGANLLHMAARNGWLDLMKDLITNYNFDVHTRDWNNATALHYASVGNHVDVVKYLVTECGCDPMVRGSYEMTPVHCAAVCGSLDVIKYLMTECNCDPMSVDESGQTVLHFALWLNHSTVVEYLLSTGKCDPLAKNINGHTLIQLANNRKEPLLVVFQKFGQIKTSHPVDSYVSILLLGNPGAGKSTLGQVILEWSSNAPSFGLFRTVKGVEPCTAGIIPFKLQHKQLGNIILHDFAGHSEYYSSHTAVIENLLQGSAAVFVLVVNILEEEALKHFQQWLTVVNNEAHKALGQCHVIVVASHVDEMSWFTSDRRRREDELQQIIAERCAGQNVVFECLDCRKLGGGSVTSFFRSLSSSCQSIRSTSERKLTLYCHMMYSLLEERKQNVLTFLDVMTAAEENKSYILPSEKEELFEILSLLHSTGLICLLKSQDKVWVVVNKQILLAEVDGILFAPKTFKQHRTGIASNTGIVTVSALSELFPNYDPDMLICFLENMALCQEIDPHSLTATNLQLIRDRDDGGRLLFFPTLLDIDRPDEMTSQVYQFGWCLQCTQEHHFFPPRYFHVLLLHLAYKYTLPQQTDKLNRRCTFWRNGLHWYNGHGIGTLVEIVDESQCVLVLMSSEEGYRENMVSLRRDVIGEVLSTYKESCPSLKVEEFLIDPTEELVYPMNKPTERTVYDVQDIISCVLERRPFIVTAKRQTELKSIISDESLLASDCSTLSLLGGRDLKELNVTIPDHDPITVQVEPVQLLDIKDLDDVVEALTTSQFGSSNWYQLGLQLGLYDPTLRDIKEACGADPKKCLLECLAAWLKREDKVTEKGGPSWLALATALNTIGEHTIASNIRKRY